jgi:hypothetical protein
MFLEQANPWPRAHNGERHTAAQPASTRMRRPHLRTMYRGILQGFDRKLIQQKRPQHRVHKESQPKRKCTHYQIGTFSRTDRGSVGHKLWIRVIRFQIDQVERTLRTLRTLFAKGKHMSSVSICHMRQCFQIKKISRFLQSGDEVYARVYSCKGPSRTGRGQQRLVDCNT